MRNLLFLELFLGMFLPAAILITMLPSLLGPMLALLPYVAFPILGGWWGIISLGLVGYIYITKQERTKRVRLVWKLGLVMGVLVSLVGLANGFGLKYPYSLVLFAPPLIPAAHVFFLMRRNLTVDDSIQQDDQS